MPRGQTLRQGQDLLDSGLEWFHLGQLGTDMHLQTAQAQVFEARGAGIEGLDPLQLDAKFVFVRAGGDFGVGVGIDVGIDPHGDRGNFSQAGGHAVNARQFRLAFRIEGVNAPAQGKGDLRLRLAHAREDAEPRIAAGGDDAAQLAFADDVKAGAQPGQGTQDGQIGIGFDSKTNAMIQSAQRGGQARIMVRESFVRIDVERGAMFSGQAPDGHILAIKFPLAALEKMHGRK